MDYIALGSSEASELIELLLRTQALLEKVEAQLYREDQPLTLTEAAKYLKVSRNIIYQYRQRREITVSQYGDKVWILRSELDDFLKRHTIKRRI